MLTVNALKLPPWSERDSLLRMLMGATADLFSKEHRIWYALGSSSKPRFSANINAGYFKHRGEAELPTTCDPIQS